MRNGSLSVITLLVGAHLLLAVPAFALNPVAFDFTATVDGAFDLTGGQVAVPGVGTTITGTYTFDADAVDQLPGVVTVGSYVDTVSCVEIDWAGGHMLDVAILDTLFEIGEITVQDDAEDLYFVTVDSDTTELNDITFDRAFVQIALRTTGNGAIVTDALPATPPDPTAFTTLRSLVVSMTPDTSVPFERAEIAATVESMSLGTVDACPVPEPGASVLLTVGLPVLALLSRRRRSGIRTDDGSRDGAPCRTCSAPVRKS